MVVIASEYQWYYSKASYLLDVEEVVMPMVNCVKRHGITEQAQLVTAVLSGTVAEWPKVTRRGVKGLFRVLYNQCNIDKATLTATWARYYMGIA